MKKKIAMTPFAIFCYVIVTISITISAAHIYALFSRDLSGSLAAWCIIISACLLGVAVRGWFASKEKYNVECY